LAAGGKLTGSMIGRRRVAITRAVGEAWERFSTERAEVVQRAFRVVGLSLPIDGSEDHQISIKGLATDFLAKRLKEWAMGGVGAVLIGEAEPEREADNEEDGEVEEGVERGEGEEEGAMEVEVEQEVLWEVWRGVESEVRREVEAEDHPSVDIPGEEAEDFPEDLNFHYD